MNKEKIIERYTLNNVIPASYLPALFKELNLNLDNFHEWMNGQTVFAIGGETIYFVDDVKRFANNLPVID